MSRWQLVGPRIPQRVWRSHLLVARGFDRSIVWDRLRRADLTKLRRSAQSSEPSLLVVHGTGLRTRMGTAGFTKGDFSALREQYGERIFAFEHRAVRHGLERNAQELLGHLEALRAPLRLHVLGLSRGGLVARMLSEGWLECSSFVQVEKLVFLATPNEGSMSARRDSELSYEMKTWRKDVRRLLLPDQSQAEFSVFSDPYLLENHAQSSEELKAWPFLVGTGDQLPGSSWLDRLNGFSGKAPHAQQMPSCRYYALASVFSFGFGALNRVNRREQSWEEITRAVFSSTPNDLVVPTAGVFQPKQGPHACGRFPIPANRLAVLRPECNATHIGMLRVPGVSSRILDWLAE